MRRVTLTRGVVAALAALAVAAGAAAAVAAAPAAGSATRLSSTTTQTSTSAEPQTTTTQTTTPQPSPALTALTTALKSGIKKIRGASGALVVDMTTGQTLYSRAAGVPRLPASVEKIYTTSTALLEFGPQATLTTRVLGVGTLDPQGVWHGTLYLKGGGDPTFGSVFFDHAAYRTGATMRQLVAALVQSVHLTAIQGGIVGDGSYFDSRRGTPPTGFAADLPALDGQLGGLIFNRGFANVAGTVRQPRPVLYAARRFLTSLRFAGVKVPTKTPVWTGSTPSSAQLLATIRSPPIAALVGLTNIPSDNFLAEMLLKGLGAQFGGAGTTAAGAAVVRSELSSRFGITPQLVDGSGFSRADLTSPQQVVTVLEQMYSNPYFVGSLATAGETGTLRHEMVHTAAQGLCHGKTGTLRDVAALAGYCQAKDGHELAFAFLANRVANPEYVHVIEGDRMAVALAKYDG